MGLITTKVTVTLSGSSIKYYEDMGYEIPKKVDKYGALLYEPNAKIEVDVNDLPRSSGILLDFECDHCGKFFQRSPNGFGLDSKIDWNNITTLCKECACKQRGRKFIGNTNASISEEEKAARMEKYRKMVYDYVIKNGHPNVIDFRSEKKLPNYGTIQRVFQIKTIYELLMLAGVKDTIDLRFFYGAETKDDVISEVYALCNHLSRDVKYTDFQPNPFNHVTIHHINKHFGTVQQMKNELKMDCIQCSYGSVYRFDDGEVCVSAFEKDFSDILRSNGFVYNFTYFRNVRYSSFCDCDSQINCDYKIILPNGDAFYFEIAGMLKNKKEEYVNNLPINDKRKSAYVDTLRYKECLLKSVGAKYFIYIPRKDNYIVEMAHIFKNVIISCTKQDNILLMA